MKKIADFYFPDEENYEFYINEIKQKGCFQKEHLYEGLKYVSNFNVAVDVGANIGTWSIEMAKHFNKVYSFEIYPPTFECLKKNIEERNLENKIFINLCGLGDKRERVSLMNDEKIHNTVASLAISYKGELKYDVLTLDDFTFEDLNFLKIDVEGYEAKVLIGGKKTITKFKPIILLEYKERKAKFFGGVKMIDAAIKELNYKKIGGMHNDIVYAHESYNLKLKK